ncbi:hypothetical protein [Paenibacillus sp. S02]|uniref:hypothetical protein n=1 Tax=Paenibacillus sp. S02 TaxID=2823904 RepID=UPI001C647A71|nr:hypothetical protein [Paenibacillus sp. S02]
MKREIRLYRPLQYDHWPMVETDLNVENYCERPKKIVVSVAREIIQTVFDMWVKTAKEEVFIFLRNAYEININDHRVKQKTLKELLAQQIWCKEMKYKHRVVTDEEIRSNLILLANKKTLIPYYVPINELRNELYTLIIDKLCNEPIAI